MLALALALRQVVVSGAGAGALEIGAGVIYEVGVVGGAGAPSHRELPKAPEGRSAGARLPHSFTATEATGVN
jgi:hypothetical protein